MGLKDSSQFHGSHMPVACFAYSILQLFRHLWCPVRGGMVSLRGGFVARHYIPALSELVCVSLSSTHQDDAWKCIPQKESLRY